MKPFALEPFDDPARAIGADEERLAVFRRVRDQIEGRLSEWLKAQAGVRPRGYL